MEGSKRAWQQCWRHAGGGLLRLLGGHCRSRQRRMDTMVTYSVRHCVSRYMCMTDHVRLRPLSHPCRVLLNGTIPATVAHCVFLRPCRIYLLSEICCTQTLHSRKLPIFLEVDTGGHGIGGALHDSSVCGSFQTLAPGIHQWSY